ncbi:MAG: DUF6491 family protein [Gammaproteobacteria bacterium]|nr:DUF6491 family protein [Gammaproteobacteria bacterium]MDH4255022.1 DUF6491 family protein [Gammaproteobacteria bacterium]
MNNSHRALVMVVVMATLSACASQESAGDAADASGKVCISVRNINGFNPLSDRELLVTANVKDYYLFTVLGICNNLRSANAIAVSDPTTRICDDGFGKIAFRDIGRTRQVCRVDQIERVGSPEEAREIVEAREQARRDQREQK